MAPRDQVVGGRKKHLQQQQQHTNNSDDSRAVVGTTSTRVIMQGQQRNGNNENNNKQLQLLQFPPQPKEPSFVQRVTRSLFLYVVVPIIVVPPLCVLGIFPRNNKIKWKDICELYHLVSDATANTSSNDDSRKVPTAEDEYYLQVVDNTSLLTKISSLPSAQHYNNNRSSSSGNFNNDNEDNNNDGCCVLLEWQKQEGYCAPATMRCVLRSFMIEMMNNNNGGGGDDYLLLPPQSRKHRGGGSTPLKWCTALHQCVNDINKNQLKKKKSQQDNDHHDAVPALQQPKLLQLTTDIVSPTTNDNASTTSSSSYQDFLNGLRKVNDDNCRVVINFLRPAIFGFRRYNSNNNNNNKSYYSSILLRWHPTTILLGLFAGHFSPVLGVLEDNNDNENENENNSKDNPLVAIFDVNHRYGLYAVRAKRLYKAVQAKDITTQRSRALIIITNINNNNTE